jgi:hypothetical protein
MSAVHSAGAIDQLARALTPHQVLVHHDFSQTPDLPLTAANVLLVPDPLRTGWGDFGFVEAIFHSFRYALEHLDFDYLQVLTPTCLPIKPMAQFEKHVSGPEAVHFSCVDVLADQDALMSVGYRLFSPKNSFRHRVLGWLTRRYFGAASGRRDVAGIWLRTGHAVGRRGRMTAVARIARTVIQLQRHALVGRHLFSAGFRPYFGSSWFGARRHVIADIVERFSRPGLREYFSRLHIADEFLIPTLLMQSGARAGPTNHYVHVFDEAHPKWIEVGDMETLVASPAFFARKFRDDPATAVRSRVLQELVGLAAEAHPAIRSDSTATLD